MKTAYEIEFRVVDTIEHRASWTVHHPELHALGEGTRYVLEPPYEPTDHELLGAVALVTTPSGEQRNLKYDFWHVGANSMLAIYFCEPNVPTIPRLSTVRFIRPARR